ncbi:hypothetical protein TNCV_1021501 [Trichonephila clavipes]|uniref:Uncharacterized protein n=1 Tax=Trichonephila clavipes TaxID=2585209 RepID=A0A8X6SN59_TRICX|nr:hypothetical protein TNCV_1021501 [Trichonephila clavipes]
MWDALGRQVAGRNYPPTNKNTLIRASQRNGINCLNSCWIMLCKNTMPILQNQTISTNGKELQRRGTLVSQTGKNPEVIVVEETVDRVRD